MFFDLRFPSIRQALIFGTVVSLLATQSVSSSAATHCDQDAYERKLLTAITCEGLKHDFRLAVRKLNAASKQEFGSLRVSSDFFDGLVGWRVEDDRSLSAQFRHFDKECELSPTSKEVLTLVFHRRNFQVDWDFDITLNIEDVNFQSRKIVPSQDYIRSEVALDLAVRSFAKTWPGSELIQLFADGGFSIKRKSLNDGKTHYRITSKRNICRLIDSIYTVDGILSSIYVNNNDKITDIY